MTQEEKELLLKDLCARLPYGVKARIVKRIQDDSTVKDCTVLSMMWMVSLEKHPEDVKPYLRPLSSMSEEERKECNKLRLAGGMAINVADYCDWLNAHHFDYRGLIPMGLALEAPKDMYNN